MKTTYRVTLLRLSADASLIDPLNHLPLELGEISAAALLPLLENLAQFDVLALDEEDPVIVIRRGDKGWRVTPGTRCLMFHDGTGTLDPIFPLDPAGIIAAIAPGGTIPPFRIPPSPVAATDSPPAPGEAPAGSPARHLGWFIFGLVAATLLLVALGIWIGLRHTGGG